MYNITAETRVTYSKYCEMEEDDYKRYLALIENNDLSAYKIDQELNKIAQKYDLWNVENQCSWDDFEEITIEPSDRDVSEG